MFENIKQAIGVLFVFCGFILAIGSEAPNLSGTQILLQGIAGVFVIYLGMKIYPSKKIPVEIVNDFVQPKSPENINELAKAIHDFRVKHRMETGQIIPIVVYIKRSYMDSLRERRANVYDELQETFEGWPVKVLPETHEVDFKIFKDIRT
jgi:hypothetical protein